MHLIFINDVPIRITSDVRVAETTERYNYLLDIATLSESLPQARGNVLVKALSCHFDQLLLAMHQADVGRLKSVTVLVEDYQHIKNLRSEQFKVVKAAGGIVNKGEKTLMIYRFGKWDLPKGKVEKEESVANAAVREVQEECGITASLAAKICSTWHTYTHKKAHVLKKTTWYAMNCLTDRNMQPQLEEDIEQVVWMDREAQQEALQNTYQTIKYVLAMYHNYLDFITKADFYEVLGQRHALNTSK